MRSSRMSRFVDFRARLVAGRGQGRAVTAAIAVLLPAIVLFLCSCSRALSAQDIASGRYRPVAAQQAGGPRVSLEGYDEAQVPKLLDEYANDLSAAGKTSDGAKVAAQAAAMRRAAIEKSRGAPSVYLDFRPDNTLHEYAAFLRSSGDATKATQADTVADQYHAMQMWNFFQQQQMRRAQDQ